MIRIRTISAVALATACHAAVQTPPPVTAPVVTAPVEAPVVTAPAEAPAALSYTALAAGAEFACALRSDATVWCWGSDELGSLGDGAPFEDRAEPQQVPGLSDVVRVVAGGGLACALTRSGSLSCWGGWNPGSDDPGERSPSPVTASAVSDLVDVAISPRDVYAVRRDGAVVRWLRVAAGRFASDAPQPAHLDDATRVGASATTVCAVTRAGPVRCVTPQGPRSLPYEPGAVRALVGGHEYIFALRGDRVERLALPGYLDAASSPASYADVVAFGQSSQAWAVATRDRVTLWGNSEYIDGSGVTGSDSDTAQRPPVSALSGVRLVAVGGDFVCAALEGTELRCWGSNEHGQLAERAPRARAFPAGGVALTGVRDLFSLENGLCATSERGPARCWNSMPYLNALFDVGVAASALPRPRAGLGDAAAIASRTQSICALSHEGALRCARAIYPDPPEGAEDLEVPPDPPPPHEEFDTPSLPSPGVSIAGGMGTFCVAMRDGTVACNTASLITTPLTFTRVAGLTGVTRVQTFDHMICALSDGAPPRCWGRDFDWGLISRSARPQQPRPVARDDLGAVVSLSAGQGHACVVERGGVVRCWGRGRAGQLGTGVFSERATPVEVPGARGAVEVAVGDAHSCARMESGTVRCWGDNGDGQLGDGAAPRGRTEPAEVPGLDHVTKIVARASLTCALREDGTVWCWGGAPAQSYGDGFIGPHLRPTQVRAE